MGRPRSLWFRLRLFAALLAVVALLIAGWQSWSAQLSPLERQLVGVWVHQSSPPVDGPAHCLFLMEDRQALAGYAEGDQILLQQMQPTRWNATPEQITLHTQYPWRKIRTLAQGGEFLRAIFFNEWRTPLVIQQRTETEILAMNRLGETLILQRSTNSEHLRALRNVPGQIYE